MARCDSAAPTTDQIAPGTSSFLLCHARRGTPSSPFTRYIADLGLRVHHSCLNSKHTPQSRHAQIVNAITPSSYGFAFRPHYLWYFSLQTAFVWRLVNGL